MSSSSVAASPASRAALTLAEWGVPVLLCEKGRIAAEQSSRKLGLDPQTGSRSARIAADAGGARPLWRRHAQALDTDIGFRQAGCTYLCADQDELAQRESWLDHARAFQIGSRMLSRKEMQDLLGDGATRFRGALYTPERRPGRTRARGSRPGAACGGAGGSPYSREHGGALDPAHGRSRERGGDGTRHRFMRDGDPRRRCLVAPLHGKPGPLPAPARDPLFCAAHRANAGNRPPAPSAPPAPRSAGGRMAAIRSGRTGAAQFEIIPAAFRHLFAFLPVLRKRWRIVDLAVGKSFFGPLGHHRWGDDGPSPFEEVRILDPEPNQKLLRSVLESARTLYPQLAGAQPVESWAGMIDVTPDEVPVIGSCAGDPRSRHRHGPVRPRFRPRYGYRPARGAAGDRARSPWSMPADTPCHASGAAPAEKAA